MGRQPLDYHNIKYHHLTGIRLIGMVARNYDNTRSDAEWLWLCDCGKQITKLARNVKRGDVRSCGCHVNRGWRQVAHHVWSHYRELGGITEEEFIQMSQLPCYYCGKFNFNKRQSGTNYWEYHGIDRLDNSLGHTLANCRTCCWRCNEKKSSDNEQEFLEWIKDIYLHRIVK
jgi:HNH endonuclease